MTYVKQDWGAGLDRLRGTLAEQKAALEIRRVASTAAMSALTGLSNGETVDADGYYASGDGGGQNFVYRSTGRSSIVIDSVFFFVGSGSVDYFESLDKSVVYGKRAGIKADGTTNDAARLQAALNATQLGYTSILDLQTGVISLTSQVTLTVLNTLLIRGNNATILKDGTAIEIYGNAQANLTLAATVANRSTTITVSNATNVGVGDIVCIYSNDNVETAWGYKANDTRKVIKITGNVLTMDSECNFDYTTGDMIGVGAVRHWKKSKVVIEQLRFETLTQVSTNGRHLHLIGVSGNASDIFCRGNRVQNAIDIWYSVDFEFNRVQLENGAYGIGIDFCRFVSVHDLKAVDYVAHPVVPASWTSHTVVDGLVIQNSEAGIDSHPAINITYDNVTQTNANAPNVRAYGVTLRNCQFTMAVAPPNPFDICPGVGSTKPRYNYLLSQFDIVLDNVVYTPPASTLYDSVILITGPCRRLVVDSCTLSGLLIEGDCEEISIQSSKLGYLSQRFAGKQSLVGVEFDWNLHKYRNDPTRVHTTSPVLWNNVNCSNYPSSGTLFGYVFMTNFSAVNCNFGLLEDLASNQTGKPTGYLFANCKIEATNDNEFNVDTSRFVNCIGSIGGQSLTDIGNSFARFNGTTDFATIPDFSIGNGTSGTVLARVRHGGINTVSGPFNFIYNAPFYYIHPSTNIWCGDLRSTWVENFTSDAAIPRTAWHWIVIRTDVTNGWEFLQATDAGTLSPRAAAAHENFTVPSSYGVIGKNRSGSEFWDGDIDRLLAFPTRLSNAQIQSIIAGGVGTGASLRYGFGAIKSNQFIDSSLNSLHATIIGTPTVIPLGGSLTIAEVDGTPFDDIWKLIVPNGSLVIVDGIATLTVGGGGTGSWGAITGTLSAQTDLQSALDTKAAKANNLSDLASAPTARTNLGLGSLATQSGTFSGTSSNTNTGDQDLSSYATTAYVVAGYIPLATSIADRVPKRSGTTGALIDSGITIDASNNMTGVAAITTSGNVNVGANSLVGAYSGIYNDGKWLTGTDDYGSFFISPFNAAFAFAPPASGGAIMTTIDFAGRVNTVTGVGLGSSIAGNTTVRYYANAGLTQASIRANDGLQIRNLADSADANLSCAAITASGAITGLNLSNTNTGDQDLSSYATTAYVDNSVIGLLDSKGPINCSANPNYPSALKGDLYHVTVAGKIGGASGIDVEVGDAIVASADNAGGTHTSVGSSWYILEHNLNGAVLVGGALGTPSSGNLANCTFPTLNQSTTGNAATVTTNANLTGHVTSVGNAAVLGAFTKAQLDTAVSDGNVLYVGDVTTNAMHTGDATGSTALTLATVNSNVGSFGSETQASIITVNAKGLVTAASASTITPAVASITGFGTGVATALAIAVGSAGGPVVNGGAIGSASYTAVRTTLIANVIADNAATITLGSGNLQSMSLVAATGAVTINFVMPTSAATGTIVLLQDDTARDVTWTSTGGGTILWAGTQPTWASDTVSSYRLLPWLYDGTRLIIGPTEICIANS